MGSLRSPADRLCHGGVLVRLWKLKTSSPLISSRTNRHGARLSRHSYLFKKVIELRIKKENTESNRKEAECRKACCGFEVHSVANGVEAYIQAVSS